MTTENDVEKKSPLCSICGRDKSTVNNCAWSSCPILWDEVRIENIGRNGDGFPDKSHY